MEDSAFSFWLADTIQSPIVGKIGKRAVLTPFSYGKRAEM